MILFWSPSQKLLLNQHGIVFDPVSRHWERTGRIDDKCEAVEPSQALRWLQKRSGTPVKVPVAVVGTRNPDPSQFMLAETIGQRLAQLGLTVLCGGKSGVMEAACRGVASVTGGVSIGLLPEDDPEAANGYVTVPIATGIGVARNAVLARAACCLVAIGGGYGTLSEIAFALQFEKRVFCVGKAPDVDGTIHCADADTVMERVVSAVLRL